MYYLDTSVLAAYYIPEALSPKVQKLFSAMKDPTLSVLTEVEFYSALSRRVREKELSKTDAQEAAALLTMHMAERLYRMLTPDQSHFAQARDWLGAFDTPLRSLDALHLALAFSHKLVLLTADKGLARAAKHLSVRCKLVS